MAPLVQLSLEGAGTETKDLHTRGGAPLRGQEPQAPERGGPGQTTVQRARPRGGGCAHTVHSTSTTGRGLPRGGDKVQRPYARCANTTPTDTMALWLQRTWPSLSLTGQMSQALPWDPRAQVETRLCWVASAPAP